MKKLIIFSIFAVPLASLITIKGTIVWYPQLLMLISVGAFVAAYFIWQINKPLAVMSLYCLHSYIFTTYQSERGLICLVTMFAGIGLICAISKIKNTALIYQAIILMACIQFALVILQVFNKDPFFGKITDIANSDIVGFAGSHNQLGIYYGGISPLIGFFLPIALVSLYFSHCTSAVLGAICGGFTYICCYSKRNAFIFLVIVALLGIFAMKMFDSPGDAFKERVSIWKLTLEQAFSGKAVMKVSEKVNHVVTANQLFGFGLGSFIMISPYTQDQAINGGREQAMFVSHRYEHAHNDLVESIFDLGLLFLMIIGWLAAELIYNFWRFRREPMVVATFSAIVALSITSMGVYVIHAPLSYFMYCLTIGLFYAEVNKCEADAPESLGF